MHTVKMENQIISKDSIGATNKSFLVPSVSQFFLYFLVSLLLLIALNVDKAWDYLNYTVLKPEGGLDSIISTNAPGIHKVLNSLFQSIVLQIIFWVFVGCAVYIILWFVRNVAINLINDLTADQYVHPANYKRYKFWSGIIARRIFFWISAAVLVAYIFVSAKTLLYLAHFSYDAVINFQKLQSIIDIAGSLIAVTSMVYITVLLVHVVINSGRLMYKDL
jgi:hypothetical protein